MTNRSGRWRRISAALLGAGAVVGAGSIGAHAAPITVRSGETFTTTVPGFAPGAVVEQRVDRLRVATARADARGRFHLRLVVPRAPGTHRIVLVGDAPRAGAPAGTVRAEIPRVVTLPVTVVPGPTVLPESTDGAGGSRSGPGGHGGGHDLDAGRVAATGIDIRLGLALAAGLGLAGAVLAACGRHRWPRRSPRRAGTAESA